MLFEVDYYETPAGRQPVKEWLDKLVQSNPKAAQNMDAKIRKLGEVPIHTLFGTSMVERIVDEDPDFYELRSGQYRVAFHHNTITGECTLLWAFKKERRNEHQEIERARRLLHEFLEGQSQRRS